MNTNREIRINTNSGIRINTIFNNNTFDTVFNNNSTVGEIVAIMPKAAEIFKQYKIDFCCGGNRKLLEVIKEHNLDEEKILEKLNEIFEENSKVKTNGKNFLEMSQNELINYIESTHHVYLRRVLPELSELTTKIMRVHAFKHEELFRVHKLFSTLRADLEQHLMKEEEILFPLIREYEKEYEKNPNPQVFEKVKQVMKETEDEHEAAGDILKELRRITNDYNVPEDGCNTYAITFKTLEELETDLFQHIHLENNILFKNWRD